MVKREAFKEEREKRERRGRKDGEKKFSYIKVRGEREMDNSREG